MLELCAHTSSHHSRPPRTECDKTTHLSYSALALAHHCQTVSVLGLLIPHPWSAGEPPDTAGFALALSSCSAVCKVLVPFEATLRFKPARFGHCKPQLNIPPLQNCSKCWHCRESFQESTFYPGSGYRKAPVTQPKSCVMQGLPSSLQQIWDLCNSHHYSPDLKMQDMAFSGLG